MRFCVQTPEDTENDINFTKEEVTKVIELQNSCKAPGGDGITADIIQHFHRRRPSFLTLIYNKCLELCYFPKQWKSSVVKLIPKTGKKDYRNANSYRLISLLSVFAKILAKLLINRINYHLRSHNQLSSSQFGFTPCVSTEDALHKTINFINNAFNRKGFALIISFDISGAFNSCFWPKILNQLKNKKCPQNLYLLTQSYFSDRTAKLLHGGVEIEKNLTLGCPQGSACGPGFWNIAYDDIFNLSDREDTQIIGFADDTNLMIFADNIQELEIKANEKLKEIESWADDNKLIFNANKTQTVLFTRNVKYNEPNVIFKGERLIIGSSVKYLGVIIDSKLSFKTHNNYIKTKATEVLNNLLRFSKSKYGLNSKALSIIYKGCILPIISYGVSVWIKSIDYEYNKRYLNAIQRRVGLRQCKAYRTVSLSACEVICDYIPIDLYLKQRALQYFIKRNISNDLTVSYFNGTHIAVELIEQQIDYTKHKHPGHAKRIEICSELNDNYIIIYGMCNDEGTGAVYEICIVGSNKVTKKLKLATYCSTFQANLLAVRSSLEYMNDHSFRDMNITIVSNNNSLVSALKNPYNKNQQIFSIYSLISELQSKYVITSLMLTNHTNIINWTEMKSKALQSIRSHNRICFDRIPVSNVLSSIKATNDYIWNQRWSESTTGMHTKNFFPTISDRKAIEKNFIFDFKTTQILTNHGSFNSYLCRFKVQNNDNCSDCIGAEDNVNHRLFECCRYNNERNAFKAKVIDSGLQWPLIYKQFLNKLIITEFVKFCQNLV